MSVQIPDLKIYQKVATKIFYATSNKVCDINFFPSCFSFKNPLTEEQIWNTVKTWLNLNECSYNARYKEEADEHSLTEFLQCSFVYDSPNTYQFLKWLECISYNIERSTVEQVRPLSEEETNALKFLDNLIIEAKNAIIGSLPEYKAAEWSKEN